MRVIVFRATKGRGRVGDAEVPRPPALTAPHAQGLSDGQIFRIITHGQGVMPAHGARVRERDRWVLVHHIRGLQQKRQERVQ